MKLYLTRQWAHNSNPRNPSPAQKQEVKNNGSKNRFRLAELQRIICDPKYVYNNDLISDNGSDNVLSEFKSSIPSFNYPNNDQYFEAMQQDKKISINATFYLNQGKRMR